MYVLTLVCIVGCVVCACVRACKCAWRRELVCVWSGCGVCVLQLQVRDRSSHLRTIFTAPSKIHFVCVVSVVNHLFWNSSLRSSRETATTSEGHESHHVASWYHIVNHPPHPRTWRWRRCHTHMFWITSDSTVTHHDDMDSISFEKVTKIAGIIMEVVQDHNFDDFLFFLEGISCWLHEKV